MFSSSYSSSSPAFYSTSSTPSLSSPSSSSAHMLASVLALTQSSSMFSSTPSPMTIQPYYYSESPLELTTAAAKSRRKTSNPQRLFESSTQQQQQQQQQQQPQHESMMKKSFLPEAFPSKPTVKTPNMNMRSTPSPVSRSMAMRKQIVSMQQGQAQSKPLQTLSHTLATTSNMSSTPEPSDTSISSGSPSVQENGNNTTMDETENKPPTKKKKASPVPDELKDADYWIRRKKNNESARKSREAKKAQAKWVEKRLVELQEDLIRAKTENKFLIQEIERLTNNVKQQRSIENDYPMAIN